MTVPHVPENRCRLVLVLPPAAVHADMAATVESALGGGDVASVILPQYDLDETRFQEQAERIVPIVQASGAAALIAGDTRVAGRSRADGLHVAGGVSDIAAAIERYHPKLIVGAGGGRDRHGALEIGELRPDYVFLGRLDGDIKPEPHAKILDLAEWWASMIEIPCIAMAGHDPNSVADAAATGAEFVAVRMAVFSQPERAGERVGEINRLLDAAAPRFEAGG